MLVNGNLVVGIPLFCRISNFGSINIREFATRIVAKRQKVIVKTDFSTMEILASLWFRITCFSAVGITNSRFFLSRIRKFGRTVWIFYSQPNSCVPSVASDHRSSGKFGRTVGGANEQCSSAKIRQNGNVLKA